MFQNNYSSELSQFGEFITRSSSGYVSLELWLYISYFSSLIFFRCNVIWRIFGKFKIFACWNIHYFSNCHCIQIYLYISNICMSRETLYQHKSKHEFRKRGSWLQMGNQYMTYRFKTENHERWRNGKVTFLVTKW